MAANHKLLLPWWLWCICLAGLLAGLWALSPWFGASTGSSSHLANAGSVPLQSPRRLPDLPAIRKPAVLLHCTVGKLQVFDGDHLVAEYDVKIDPLTPRPGRVVLNRELADSQHGPLILLSDTGPQPKTLAVLHADPLPADVRLPGATMNPLQLRQLMSALPVGTPVTILR